jgi:hypothetical protein
MPVIDFLPPASRRSHGRSLSPWRDRSQHQPPKQVYGRVAAGPQKVSGTKMVRKTKEFGRDSKKPTFPSSSPLTPATESGSRRAEMDASFPDIGAHWKPSPGYRVSCAGRVCRGCYHRGETISSRQRAVLTVDHMAREIHLTFMSLRPRILPPGFIAPCLPTSVRTRLLASTGCTRSSTTAYASLLAGLCRQNNRFLRRAPASPPGLLFHCAFHLSGCQYWLTATGCVRRRFFLFCCCMTARYAMKNVDRGQCL